MNTIVRQDLQRIYDALSERERAALRDSSVLITGCAGFLGFYLVQFLAAFRGSLGIRRIIGLDNFKTGFPLWLKRLADAREVELVGFNIVTDDISRVPGASEAAYILHMASIASPLFYRKYPIETLDANVEGLRRLLGYYHERPIRGFAFFSSSEVYGDPAPEWIPTPETYRGNVSCQGPRACYDEAKRFGETLCYLYHQKYAMPLRIIRPFNNYGPGMRLNDARVPADFARAVYEGRDIVMFSDGTPTRTFCYISDAVTGYLKVLLHKEYDTFNIGMDKPEISIRELAAIYCEAGREVFGYTGKASFSVSEDGEYLTNSPNRRCPVIAKARELLGYAPQVDVRQGVRLFLNFIRESSREELLW
ncbi:NAD-dependent epimerase/dehydratase family protein [uncultured Mailhella sp.]|uniref:NAD-dependent epimerase/dehydratase family protein n=1 Tax=uncultured Mailhella sp. TaxID=1981031 RepID=UPI0026197801|nr:NAD-dependent epimerase/dehydratase family protein [uncultured Mailhella sp.]